MYEVLREIDQYEGVPKFANYSRMTTGNLRKRLQDIRSNTVELAKFMGLSYDQTDRIVNGRRKKLSAQETSDIERFFASRERPAYEENPGFKRGRGVESAQAFAEIPLYGGNDTREGWMLQLNAGSQVGRVMPHPAQASARHAYAVEVVDDTMAPRFEPGEIAYVAAGQMPRKGQDCLVEFPDLTARILQFVARGERSITFKQLNPPQQITKPISEKLQVHAIVGRG